MGLYESGENYLETILLLQERNGFVRSIDIANELDYSKPSISRAMHVLAESGYITMPRGGKITLTKKGELRAKEIYERHEIITKFLSCVLGVSPEVAEHDACRIEHIISDEVLEKMKVQL